MALLYGSTSPNNSNESLLRDIELAKSSTGFSGDSIHEHEKDGLDDSSLKKAGEEGTKAGGAGINDNAVIVVDKEEEEEKEEKEEKKKKKMKKRMMKVMMTRAIVKIIIPRKRKMLGKKGMKNVEMQPVFLETRTISLIMLHTSLLKKEGASDENVDLKKSAFGDVDVKSAWKTITKAVKQEMNVISSDVRNRLISKFLLDAITSNCASSYGWLTEFHRGIYIRS